MSMLMLLSSPAGDGERHAGISFQPNTQAFVLRLRIKSVAPQHLDWRILPLFYCVCISVCASNKLSTCLRSSLLLCAMVPRYINI